MPGPDPDAVWIGSDERTHRVFYEAYLWTGNDGNRKKRAMAMVRRLARHDWKCRWCGEPLPAWRRVDAKYCRERCRKRAARWRRNEQVRQE